MRRIIKDIQYIIHKHYELIKLALLTIILILVTITYSNGLAAEQRRERNDERINKELISLAHDIDRTQQKQHDHQDERQACFFNLFISYTNNTPRKAITQEDANRCRVAGSDTTTFPDGVPVSSNNHKPAASSQVAQTPTTPSGNQLPRQSNGLLGLCKTTDPLPVLGGILAPVVGCKS